MIAESYPLSKRGEKSVHERERQIEVIVSEANVLRLMFRIRWMMSDDFTHMADMELVACRGERGMEGGFSLPHDYPWLK